MNFKKDSKITVHEKFVRLYVADRLSELWAGFAALKVTIFYMFCTNSYVGNVPHTPKYTYRGTFLILGMMNIAQEH